MKIPVYSGIFFFIIFILKDFMPLNKTYGIDFPFNDSTLGKYLKLTDNSIDEIRANLIHLLLTRKGSRYFLPDFGTRLYEFIFEPMDGQTFDAIKADIRQSVEVYIPNLQIDNITISEYTEDDNSEGQINYDELGGEIFRIPGRGTQEYTAKVRLDFTISDGVFTSKDFIIINI